MWPSSYWANRYWPPRYWPKIGSSVPLAITGRLIEYRQTAQFTGLFTTPVLTDSVTGSWYQLEISAGNAVVGMLLDNAAGDGRLLHHRFSVDDGVVLDNIVQIGIANGSITLSRAPLARSDAAIVWQPSTGNIYRLRGSLVLAVPTITLELVA
jgi:hypothetical protein